MQMWHPGPSSKRQRVVFRFGEDTARVPMPGVPEITESGFLESEDPLKLQPNTPGDPFPYDDTWNQAHEQREEILANSKDMRFVKALAGALNRPNVSNLLESDVLIPSRRLRAPRQRIAGYETYNKRREKLSKDIVKIDKQVQDLRRKFAAAEPSIRVLKDLMWKQFDRSQQLLFAVFTMDYLYQFLQRLIVRYTQLQKEDSDFFSDRVNKRITSFISIIEENMAERDRTNAPRAFLEEIFNYDGDDIEEEYLKRINTGFRRINQRQLDVGYYVKPVVDVPDLDSPSTPETRTTPSPMRPTSGRSMGWMSRRKHTISSLPTNKTRFLAKYTVPADEGTKPLQTLFIPHVDLNLYFRLNQGAIHDILTGPIDIQSWRPDEPHTLIFSSRVQKMEILRDTIFLLAKIKDPQGNILDNLIDLCKQLIFLIERFEVADSVLSFLRTSQRTLTEEMKTMQTKIQSTVNGETQLMQLRDTYKQDEKTSTRAYSFRTTRPSRPRSI